MDSRTRVHLYQMAEFFRQVLGSSYHFAFYDVEDLALQRPTFLVGEESMQHSISCTEMVRKLTMDQVDANEYYQLGIMQDGMPGYRNHTFFIKNEDGSLAGIFVVSEQYAAKMKLLTEIENMFNIRIEECPAPAVTNDADLVAVSISTLPRLVRQLLDELEIETSGNLTPHQKDILIHKLREHGAFKLKGSVPIIAQLLNTSIPTVYRYLNKLEQQGALEAEVSRESIRLL